MIDQDDSLKAKLSLFLDGEMESADTDRFIAQMEKDEALNAAWSRYHLAADVLRNPRGALADNGFAARVSAAIDNEPTIFAPRTPDVARGESRRKVASLALAASLAGVAIMIGKSMNAPDGGFLANTATLQTESTGLPGWKSDIATAEQSRFDDYLVIHNERALAAGSAGMLAHVRVISSSGER